MLDAPQQMVQLCTVRSCTSQPKTGKAGFRPSGQSTNAQSVKEAAMQFFSERKDMPGREDFYYCSACGSTWEM
jgi:hypothetical protein